MRVLEVFDHFQIEYKTNKKSIILKHCPACGKDKNSVWLFKPQNPGTSATKGNCWVCGEVFSTYTYLEQYGFDKTEILRELKETISPRVWDMPDILTARKQAEIPIGPLMEEIKVPSHFFKVTDWPQHPASIYARSRGVVGKIGETVFIDPIDNSVAFPMFYEQKLVGFQKRYVNPTTIKTKTDANLNKGQCFIKLGDPSHPILIVEGPFDAVAAVWMGYYAYCTMGAAISRYQARQIALEVNNRGEESVKVALDPDLAGERGTREVAIILNNYGIEVDKCVIPSQYNDLNDYLCRHTGMVFEEMQEYFIFDDLLKFEAGWQASIMLLEDLPSIKAKIKKK